MAAIAALLVVATLSVLVVRISSIALSMTGLSDEVARLQAQSAFTGAGFTTTESEMVISHPVRRRIIRLLMLMGNIGFTSVVATLILSFVQAQSATQGLLRFLVILAGVGLLWGVTRLRLFNDWLDRVIKKALKRAGAVAAADYGRLLRVRAGYTISSITVDKESWLADQPLDESRPGEEGVIILGIEREDGSYLGAPSSKTVIHPGDQITVYGAEEDIRELAQRERDLRGVREHDEAKREARERQARELKRDRRRVQKESEQRERRGDGEGGTRAEADGEPPEQEAEREKGHGSAGASGAPHRDHSE